MHGRIYSNEHYSKATDPTPCGVPALLRAQASERNPQPPRSISASWTWTLILIRALFKKCPRSVQARDRACDRVLNKSLMLRRAAGRARTCNRMILSSRVSLFVIAPYRPVKFSAVLGRGDLRAASGRKLVGSDSARGSTRASLTRNARAQCRGRESALDLSEVTC